jgi:hypothetical protein
MIFVSFNSHTTGVTSGARNSYPSYTPSEFTPGFLWHGDHVAHSFVFCVVFCRPLFVLLWLIDWFLVFNATFSNISWRPVLVVEEAGVPGENHRPWASNWWTLSLAAASRMHPFVIYKAGREPKRIGDRLVWVVR